MAWNSVKLGGLRELEKNKLLAEVELLKQLDHKNIIRIAHSWLAEEPSLDGETKEYRFNFITEKCSDNLRKCAARPPAARPRSLSLSWLAAELSPLAPPGQLLPQAQEGRPARAEELVEADPGGHQLPAHQDAARGSQGSEAREHLHQ